MARRQATEEQRAAAKERRRQMGELARRIAAMTDEQRAEMQKRMPSIATIEGHALSFHNTAMIIMQNGEHATVVGGFRQWKKAGRFVRKGEHGFAIWAPRKKKTAGEDTIEVSVSEIDADEDLSFLLVTVFDVSQTDELSAASDAQESEAA